MYYSVDFDYSLYITNFSYSNELCDSRNDSYGTVITYNYENGLLKCVYSNNEKSFDYFYDSQNRIQKTISYNPIDGENVIYLYEYETR